MRDFPIGDELANRFNTRTKFTSPLFVSDDRQSLLRPFQWPILAHQSAHDLAEKCG
jgi:hypothetical protein